MPEFPAQGMDAGRRLPFASQSARTGRVLPPQGIPAAGPAQCPQDPTAINELGATGAFGVGDPLAGVGVMNQVTAAVGFEGNGTIGTVDVTDRANPTIVTTAALGIEAWDMHPHPSEDNVFVVADQNGPRCTTLDVSDPNNPVLMDSVGAAQWQSFARAVAVIPGTAVIANGGDQKAHTIDITDPNNLSIRDTVSSGNLDFVELGIAVNDAGTHAFGAGEFGSGITSIDISDPDNISIEQNIGGASGAQQVAVDAATSTLWIAADDFTGVDISDPANMSVVGTVNVGGNAHFVGIHDSVGYVNSLNDNTIRSVDVSDPNNPTIEDSVAINFSNEGDIAIDGGGFKYITTPDTDNMRIFC